LLGDRRSNEYEVDESRIVARSLAGSLTEQGRGLGAACLGSKGSLSNLAHRVLEAQGDC
jgi:hypothetical protein